jgi:hypothetical protein
MSTVERKIEELRREPAHWLGYDEETRELLKQKRPGAVRKEFETDVEGCPSMMG